MKEPKTISQYIKIMRMLDKTSVSDKMGFDKLSKETQSLLAELSASISNIINEIPYEKTN
jgi:hypothetical protein